MKAPLPRLIFVGICLLGILDASLAGCAHCTCKCPCLDIRTDSSTGQTIAVVDIWESSLSRDECNRTGCLDFCDARQEQYFVDPNGSGPTCE